MAGYMKLVRCAVSQAEMTEGDARELELVALTAIEAIARGHGTPHEWNSLANAINHAWALARNGIGPEIEPALTAAEQEMRDVQARYHRTGRMGFGVDGLPAMRLALELWGGQLRLCSVGEVDAATRLVSSEQWKKSHE